MATDRVVALADVELRITEAGEGGRPLLLAHGFTGSRTDFADFIEPLAAAGWHVVAPDHRGHGDSDKPDGEDRYSLRIFAADLLDLADAVGWGRFVLLGHSMGGMIAQELALLAPERLAGLILMDTGHGPVEVDPDLAQLGAQVARDQGMDVLAELSKTIEDPLVNEAYLRHCEEDPTYAERGERNLRASSPAMYAAMIGEIVGQADRLGRLGVIGVPTLVLVGEHDGPFLGPSRRMAETIPDARLAVVAGGGHSPQLEAADGWWDAVSGFLADIAASVPAPAAEASA